MFITTRNLNWLLATVSLSVAGNSMASHEYRNEHIEYAKVTDVRPIVRLIDVSTPRQECWQEPVHHVEVRDDYTTGRTILGGIIGAAIGNQIGRGRGNDAATVVGGLAGAAVGANSARAERYEERHVDYEDRCRTTYQHHQEERIDGYEVTYRFAGQEYTTVMAEKPGKRIPVNVQVRPAYQSPYSH